MEWQFRGFWLVYVVVFLLLAVFALSVRYRNRTNGAHIS